MATKAASHAGPNPHTAGIFADMTVDGPEIGTLVLVVDRAKNLPNRKTMGKQNPYCAARLGKEAKKTETDRRGGQTPRWDQEIRFVVHDSPDYFNLKISLFSEDKRTDLIGEAWISLDDIIVPGGGKKDLWQGLHCKGKYAGDLRIELTYYDARPKPEKAAEEEDLRQSVGHGASRVKRRPLPSNPNSGHVTPDSITPLGPPGRAKHGPRDLNSRMPPRANSMPPEAMVQHQHQHSTSYGFPSPMSHSQGSSPAQQYHPTHQYEAYDNYDEPGGYDDAQFDPHQTPDFLPQLPPSNRNRGPPRQQPPFTSGRGQPMPHPRPQSHIGIPHSYSAPVIPHVHPEPQSYDDDYQLHTDDPEPIPDLEYQHQQLETRPRRRSEVPPHWQNEYGDPHSYGQHEVEESPAPPLPPMHTHSAPIVPHFSSPHGHPTSSPLGHGATPPSARHYSVPSIPNSSPLQSIERKYATPRQSPGHGHPARGASMDSYIASPEQRSYEGSPSFPPGQTPSPYTRPLPATRPLPQHRLSVAETYNTSTPPRPHPLSQEVPRPRSPNPPQMPDFHNCSPLPNNQSPYQRDYRPRDAAPPMNPRAPSPQPGHPSSQPNSAQRPRSSYNIQFPVRGFESSDSNPLSTSRPPSNQATPSRKSISSQQPSPLVGPSPTLPFSPDSFNVHNPNAHQSTLPTGSSPHTPYQVRPGSQAASPHDTNSGPIVGWHGQEIDPSDHLPVDSWAPEPEKKTPTKTYGLGRERDFGPRTANSGTNSAPRNLSKDTVVNVRMKSQSQPQSPIAQPEPEPSRNRLQKKNGPGKSPIMEPMPLRERHNYNSVSVPDPYAQQQQYSRGFHQPADNGYPSYGSSGNSPTDALSREISNIDIGSGRNSRAGGVPSPVAYVPVRSHKDRNNFY